MRAIPKLVSAKLIHDSKVYVRNRPLRAPATRNNSWRFVKDLPDRRLKIGLMARNGYRYFPANVNNARNKQKTATPKAAVIRIWREVSPRNPTADCAASCAVFASCAACTAALADVSPI